MHACMHACMCACMYLCLHIHVCMYVCMYACMYSCIFIFVCMHVCIYLYACMYATCMFVCMHICMYVCSYMHVCLFVCMCVSVHDKNRFGWLLPEYSSEDPETGDLHFPGRLALTRASPRSASSRTPRPASANSDSPPHDSGLGGLWDMSSKYCLAVCAPSSWQLSARAENHGTITGSKHTVTIGPNSMYLSLWDGDPCSSVRV